MLVRPVASIVSLFGRRWTPAVLDSVYILASLAAFVVLIVTLGALGFGVGLGVFPFGEDNNWIDMLRRGSGAEAARLLWAIDHRNPLSPWWYIAARDVILQFDAGLLALRYGTAAVLSLATYCMVLTVAGPRSRAFALGLAMLSIFWMANRYTEQIIWNFQGALAASLLSVAGYARFVQEGQRRRYRLYACSIVFWFVAFATYTIQCGAILAIGYLAFRRAPVDHDNTLRSILERARTAILDTAPHLAVFGLFLLVWQTTMGSFAPAMSLQFRIAAILESLKEGIWSSDLTLFYHWVVTSPDRLAFIVAAGVCGGVAFVALQWRERGSTGWVPGIAMNRLMDVLVIVACIAAPTVSLESGSDTWTPGTRWPMIYQLTTPVLLLGVVAIALATTTSHLRSRLWNAAVALAIGIGALFSLGHNRRQIEITSNEKFIRDSVLRLVAEDLAVGHDPPMQVLLMLDKPNRLTWRSADMLSPTMARVWLRRDDISFRLVPWLPASSRDRASRSAIRFGPDSEGVGNATVSGGTVPYQQLRILYVSGRAARRVTSADREDFAGWGVEWSREGPFALPPVDVAHLCPITWSADRNFLSDGWSEGERDDKGPVRWTMSRSARLIFPATCDGHLLLRVVVAYAISMRNIERLNVMVNGRNLSYHRTFADGNVVYEAEFDRRIVTGPLFEIDLAVDALQTPPGGTRSLGIAVRRVEVLPIKD
jgi:hypothetical protein